MTKEKLPNGYVEWINLEKEITAEAYDSYKAEGRRQKAKIRTKKKVKRIKVFNSSYFLRIAAAAALILALGTTLWVKKDEIFKPKYTEEQIALSYEHAVKTLAVCASSLSKEMGKLKNLNQIPESLDDQNQLENIKNN